MDGVSLEKSCMQADGDCWVEDAGLGLWMPWDPGRHFQVLEMLAHVLGQPEPPPQSPAHTCEYGTGYLNCSS